jgi:HEAT repeat protein
MRYAILLVLSMGLLVPACSRGPAGPDIQALVEMLRSSDPLVRGKGTTDLVTIGEPAVPAIIPLLSDPEARVRETAASTLWGMGIKAREAVPQLAEALKDPAPAVRASAAMALGGIGPDAKAAVPALIRSLRDRDRNARMWAVKALGEIGPAAEKAVPVLRRMVKDEFLGSTIEDTIRKINVEVATSAAPSRH